MADGSSMDFDALRQAGLRQLERLAGAAWTDFNPQDPGITILEQCCYALTELAYRCEFALPDLLASDGRDPAASLYSAARILSTRPVTLADVRKLAIDVRGVRNAWFDKVQAPDPAVWLDRDGLAGGGDHAHGLVLLEPGTGTEALPMKGLYRVRIEAASELGVSAAELTRNVARRLHAARPLGMDFAAIDVLQARSIRVRAAIEIAADARADAVYAAVLLAIARHMSPAVRFRTLAECLEQGWQVDDIIDGPALEQGFIATDELALLERTAALRVSDLIRVLMGVEGVALVLRLSLSSDGVAWHDWSIDIEDGYVATFDAAASDIVLQRRGFALSVDAAAATEQLRAALAANAYRPARPEELDLPPPPGRDRHTGAYYSIQHHFPENYGLGARGLPQDADSLRRAQLRQLQAYLLLFDQLLANQFAQLAGLGDLLGFAGDAEQTYFAGEIDDPELGVDALWRRTDPAARRARLARIVEDPAANGADPDQSAAPDWLRKNRLLDHLLARVSESFADPAGLLPFEAGADAQARLRELARAKRAWLRRYPQLSAGRGTGRDLVGPDMPGQAAGGDGDAGLAQRLYIKLGLSPDRMDQRFHLVEHLLLRPVAADAGQGALPLLADARGADPYSLQLSLVMPGWSGKAAVPQFRSFVEQSVRDEVPAHLFAHVLWLDQAAMDAFTDAHDTWLACLRTVRTGQETRSDWFRYRDARDRVIDLLGLGHSYPLADLAVRYTDAVAWGQQGSITLAGAQPGVVYELLAKNGAPLVPPLSAIGAGADLALATPAITADVDFLLRATRGASGLARMLLARPRIKVGLDVSLAASMPAAAPLDPRDLGPAAARIVDYGGQPVVNVQGSQAGVDYRLLRADGAAPDGFATMSIADVRGDGAGIGLQTVPMGEDSELRIRATKTFDAAEGMNTQTALLNAVLPLAVRADPGRTVTLPAPQVDYGAGAKVVVGAAQASARYQLVARALRDSDFLREDAGGIALPGMPALWVARPPVPTPDLQARGAAAPGAGADLALPIDALQEDCLVAVQALKSHTAPHGAPIGSSVQLLAFAVILVRPGTAADFPLHLRRKDGAAAGAGLKKDVTYLVENGQPGVYYHVRRAGSDQDLGVPVYFHKAGKGIGGLALEIDFAVAAALPSPPAEWDCPVDLAAGAKLSIRAVKAQTGLESVFTLTAGALLGAP